MDTVSYALKADEVDSFRGGVIRAGDRDVDLAEALNAGGGVIVAALTDYELVNALDGVDVLERTAPGTGADVPTVSPYAGTNVEGLRDELRRRNLPTGGKREELEQRLEADDNPTPASDDNDTAGDGEEV